MLFPQAGGLFQKTLVLLPPLGEVSGEGTEDVYAYRQNKSIVEQSPNPSSREDHMKKPTGDAAPHDGSIQLVDTVSSCKQTCKHHSHDRLVPSLGLGQ